MKKYIFILSLFFLLNSCQEKSGCGNFTNLSNVIEYGNKVHKISLLCLSNNNEEKYDIGDNPILTNNLLCYNLSASKEEKISKIIYPLKGPLYILLEGDNIIAILEKDDIKEFVKVKDEKSICDFIINYSSQIFPNEEITYINSLLKLYCYIEKKETGVAINIDFNNIESIINKKNQFYGKYLLAQLYKDININKADKFYNELWLNSTPDEIKNFPEEFMDIMKNRNRLILVDNENIKFDYTTFNLGSVPFMKEVKCKFYYTNISDNRFVIYNVITTCGCTVPFWNRQPINPNGHDSILVKFVAKEMGVNNKTIVVEGNCKKKIYLKINALVE